MLVDPGTGQHIHIDRESSRLSVGPELLLDRASLPGPSISIFRGEFRLSLLPTFQSLHVLQWLVVAAISAMDVDAISVH